MEKEIKERLLNQELKVQRDIYMSKLYNNYVKFFDKQVAGPQINSKALSFKEIVGILNEDKIEERTRSNNKTYAGGYYV